MIDKLIIDGAHIELTEKDKLPYTYQFSTAKTHTVKYALSDTDEISANAFAGCAYMTAVRFPEQIKMIKRRAFENCERLNNVVIPKTIQYIGANVWNGCKSLTEMHFEHTGTESDPIPTNYSEVPSNCKVYIPNECKYKRVEKDASGKNIGMNPDSVDYYTKTDWNLYEYVAPQVITETGDYYYDVWTGIAPNNQTIEEQNRIPIESIDFEQSSIQTTVGNVLILKYNILPENATNRRIHFYINTDGKTLVPAQDNNYDAIVVNDVSVEGEIQIRCNLVSIQSIEIYAESGASAKCTLRVRQ